MLQQVDLGGSFTLPGTSMTVNRMGYGAMQLAGPQVYGPPRDVDVAIAVLREAGSSRLRCSAGDGASPWRLVRQVSQGRLFQTR